MTAASLRSRYLGDAVSTASPQQVLVMLYDRLALDLERAQTALAAGRRGDAREQVRHAQEIVFELLGSLRVDAWEGGPRLAALYNWLIAELNQAMVKQDSGRIASCLKVVEPLRDAWRQAAMSLAAGTAGGTA
jgi:flagellar secretion chaperone FliS